MSCDMSAASTCKNVLFAKDIPRARKISLLSLCLYLCFLFYFLFSFFYLGMCMCPDAVKIRRFVPVFVSCLLYWLAMRNENFRANRNTSFLTRGRFFLLYTHSRTKSRKKLFHWCFTYINKNDYLLCYYLL
jgi:hypothetical protein